ncbi:hypothetical protein ACE193_15245 [Bernardetia sp. OM2101]|uniref:hypothetical protein n=1 Tax=Bernardetia sp. OM2101 TaxID=3344876 RepID=UPI0035CFADA3
MDKNLIKGKGLTQAKGNYQDTLLQLAVVLGSGVVGGAASAFVGKGSGIIGIVTAGIGVYFDLVPLTVAGTAMTANGFSRNGALGSLNGGMNGVKDGIANLKQYATNLKHSVFLDKIIPDDEPQLSGFSRHFIAPSSSHNFNGIGNLKFIDKEEEAMYRSMFSDADEVQTLTSGTNAKGELI